MCRMWFFFNFFHLDVHVNMINWKVISYLFLPNKLSKAQLLKTTTCCFSGLCGSAGLLPNLIWTYSWGFQQLALQLGLRWSIVPLRDFEWTLLADLSSSQALVSRPPAGLSSTGGVAFQRGKLGVSWGPNSETPSPWALFSCPKKFRRRVLWVWGG